MIASKAQEREALSKIREIVESLGPDSYVGTAFDGCFMDAEQNIENDYFCSMKQRMETTLPENANLKEAIKELEQKGRKDEGRIRELEEQLEHELDWKPALNTGTKMDQERYRQLSAFCDAEMDDAEAKRLVAEEFGFSSERIEIVREASTYEVNKHHMLRMKETYDRSPMYCATDWNYIRFNVRGNITWCYEMVNGELYPYYH